MLVKPKKLSPGDTVAVVTLSWGGPGQFPQRYQIGKKQLQDTFGFKVIETPHALKDPAWIARNPAARAEDLMSAFSDPKVSGIISAIGGDDSIRILPHLDLEVIRRNPKVFCGFSDTTVTHFACMKAGIGSFYGPSLLAGFDENTGIPPFLADSFRSIVMSSASGVQMKPNFDGWTEELLEWGDTATYSIKRKLNQHTGWRWLQGSGVHAGPLIGGCIEVVDWLRGTDVWPTPDQLKGAILFFETSEEAPSPTAVKRMLRSLEAAGMFNHCAGLLFGRPVTYRNAPPASEYDEAILSVIRDELQLAHIPVVSGLDFGHTAPIMTLPYSVKAQIDCDKRTIVLSESAVTN